MRRQNDRNNCQGAEKKKKEIKELRTVSETSRTIINAPKFKLLAFQKKINKGYDKICEEIIVENFPTIGKEISTQVQEAQRVPHSINPKINTTHILITLKKN